MKSVQIDSETLIGLLVYYLVLQGATIVEAANCVCWAILQNAKEENA